jgi:MinD superfamily P-loop ATPase
MSRTLKTTAKPVIELGDTAPNLLAEAIVDVAAGAKKLLGSRLSKRAVLLLVRDKTGGRVSLTDIETILDAAADLGSYVKR